MKKFAVIDIGSNSVRLMFVADGNVLYKRLNTTRLGEGLAQKPLLNPEAIERTAQAVAEFAAQARQAGAEGVFPFATAAVRTAENRQVFIDRVYALCGLQVEVIAGEKEAEIGLLGALGRADGAVLDIGGASTELVVKRGGEIHYKKSINIGVVRLKDACGREKAALLQAAKEGAAQFGTPPTDTALYGIGGTATTLAAQYLGLKEYRSDVITGTSLSVEEVEALAERFLQMPLEKIAALPCMPVGRADVITGGAVLLATLMRTLGYARLTVSDRDNLEGYAIMRGLME